jgi:hypothetical protein
VLTFPEFFFIIFLDEGIDGHTFMGLSVEELIGIGFKLGPSLKLLKFIELRKEKK